MKAKEKTNAFRHSLVWLGLFMALFCAVLLLCAPKADAAYVVASGDCGADGDDVKWSLNSNGTLTISGNGEMDCNADYYYYRDDIATVVIKSGVTIIAEEAFYGCGSLKSVTIPDSVMSIGADAFDDTALYNKKANWTNGVLYIGKYLIRAKSLSGTYKIKAGTRCIADCAFEDCNDLKYLTIPDGMTSIGYYAFSDCYSLIGVTIPDSLTYIGRYAFDDTALYNESSNYVGDVLYLGNHLIKAKTSLSGSYKIKAGTRCIAGEAFYNCGSLTKVTIPSSVTGVGDYAFLDCSSLTSVTIPASVTSIGYNAFTDCSEVVVMNPKCQIGMYAFGNSATIYGYKNSTAQEYAEDNGLKFVALCSHTYSSSIYTKKATTTANGMTYKKCTKCGAAKRITTIYKVSTVKLSKTSYVYIGKARTPTPIVQDANGNNLKLNTDYKLKYSSGRKECGTYAVKVVFMGNYAGKKTLKFKIRLGQVTGLTQVSSDALKSGERFKLTWNKVTGATQYQVWVKQGNEFKIAATTAETEKNNTNKKLTKGQKIEVKVRALRITGDGTTYYGAFSSVYTVTVR